MEEHLNLLGVNGWGRPGRIWLVLPQSTANREQLTAALSATESKVPMTVKAEATIMTWISVILRLSSAVQPYYFSFVALFDLQLLQPFFFIPCYKFASDLVSVAYGYWFSSPSPRSHGTDLLNHLLSAISFLKSEQPTRSYSLASYACCVDYPIVIKELQ